MTAPAQRVEKKMTADELLRMPDDEYRYELVRGELRKMVPAGHAHGRIAMNISTPLDQHVRSNKLGTVYAAETGFILARNPDTVRAADVAFVRKERVDALEEEEGYWPGAPDLAVEVVFPNDAYADVEEKVFDWLDAGTRMVLVVNSRKNTVTRYRSRDDIAVFTEDETLPGNDVVPGWTLSVGDIFA